MDFHSLKRKELQGLCKKHRIPANLTNREMADRLASIFKENEDPVFIEKLSTNLEEIGSESETKVVKKQSKKVRFSPDNQTIEYEVSVYQQPKRSRRQTLFKNPAQVLENAPKSEDNQDIKILGGCQLRVTRSRVQNAVEEDINMVYSPPGGRKRGRGGKNGKDAKEVSNIGDSERLELGKKEAVNNGPDKVIGGLSGKQLRSRKNVTQEDSKKTRNTEGGDKVHLLDESSDAKNGPKQQSTRNARKGDQSVAFSSDVQKVEVVSRVTRQSREKSKDVASMVNNEVKVVEAKEGCVVEKPQRRSTRNSENDFSKSATSMKSERRVTKVREQSERDIALVEPPQCSRRYSSRRKSVGSQSGKGENKGELLKEGTRKRSRTVELDAIVEDSGEVERDKCAVTSQHQTPLRRSRRKTVILTAPAAELANKKEIGRMKQLRAPIPGNGSTEELPRMSNLSGTSKEDRVAVAENEHGVKQQTQEPIREEEETSASQHLPITQKPQRRSSRITSISASVGPPNPTAKDVKKKQQSKSTMEIVGEEAAPTESLPSPGELPAGKDVLAAMSDRAGNENNIDVEVGKQVVKNGDTCFNKSREGLRMNSRAKKWCGFADASPLLLKMEECKDAGNMDETLTASSVMLDRSSPDLEVKPSAQESVTVNEKESNYVEDAIEKLIPGGNIESEVNCMPSQTVNTTCVFGDANFSDPKLLKFETNSSYGVDSSQITFPSVSHGNGVTDPEKKEDITLIDRHSSYESLAIDTEDITLLESDKERLVQVDAANSERNDSNWVKSRQVEVERNAINMDSSEITPIAGLALGEKRDLTGNSNEELPFNTPINNDFQEISETVCMDNKNMRNEIPANILPQFALEQLDNESEAAKQGALPPEELTASVTSESISMSPLDHALMDGERNSCAEIVMDHRFFNDFAATIDSDEIIAGEGTDVVNEYNNIVDEIASALKLKLTDCSGGKVDAELYETKKSDTETISQETDTFGVARTEYPEEMSNAPGAMGTENYGDLDDQGDGVGPERDCSSSFGVDALMSTVGIIVDNVANVGTSGSTLDVKDPQSGTKVDDHEINNRDAAKQLDTAFTIEVGVEIGEKELDSHQGSLHGCEQEDVSFVDTPCSKIESSCEKEHLPAMDDINDLGGTEISTECKVTREERVGCQTNTGGFNDVTDGSFVEGRKLDHVGETAEAKSDDCEGLIKTDTVLDSIHSSDVNPSLCLEERKSELETEEPHALYFPKNITGDSREVESCSKLDIVSSMKPEMVAGCSSVSPICVTSDKRKHLANPEESNIFTNLEMSVFGGVEHEVKKSDTKADDSNDVAIDKTITQCNSSDFKEGDYVVRTDVEDTNFSAKKDGHKDTEETMELRKDILGQDATMADKSPLLKNSEFGRGISNEELPFNTPMINDIQEISEAVCVDNKNMRNEIPANILPQLAMEQLDNESEAAKQGALPPEELTAPVTSESISMSPLDHALMDGERNTCAEIVMDHRFFNDFAATIDSDEIIAGGGTDVVKEDNNIVDEIASALKLELTDYSGGKVDAELYDTKKSDTETISQETDTFGVARTEYPEEMSNVAPGAMGTENYGDLDDQGDGVGPKRDCSSSIGVDALMSTVGIIVDNIANVGTLGSTLDVKDPQSGTKVDDPEINNRDAAKQLDTAFTIEIGVEDGEKELDSHQGSLHGGEQDDVSFVDTPCSKIESSCEKEHLPAMDGVNDLGGTEISTECKVTREDRVGFQTNTGGFNDVTDSSFVEGRKIDHVVETVEAKSDDCEGSIKTDTTLDSIHNSDVNQSPCLDERKSELETEEPHALYFPENIARDSREFESDSKLDIVSSMKHEMVVGCSLVSSICVTSVERKHLENAEEANIFTNMETSLFRGVEDEVKRSDTKADDSNDVALDKAITQCNSSDFNEVDYVVRTDVEDTNFSAKKNGPKDTSETTEMRKDILVQDATMADKSTLLNNSEFGRAIVDGEEAGAFRTELNLLSANAKKEASNSIPVKQLISSIMKSKSKSGLIQRTPKRPIFQDMKENEGSTKRAQIGNKTTPKTSSKLRRPLDRI